MKNRQSRHPCHLPLAPVPTPKNTSPEKVTSPANTYFIVEKYIPVHQPHKPSGKAFCAFWYALVGFCVGAALTSKKKSKNHSKTN